MRDSVLASTTEYEVKNIFIITSTYFDIFITHFCCEMIPYT